MFPCFITAGFKANYLLLTLIRLGLWKIQNEWKRRMDREGATLSEKSSKTGVFEKGASGLPKEITGIEEIRPFKLGKIFSL